MNKYKEELDIVIVGSGTAGLISALMLQKAFPVIGITVVSSSKIGIVGVGEGSTEHWRSFMGICNIPLFDLLKETDATHKYGIRFENWSNAHPDYFHSISGEDETYAYGLFPMWNGFIDNNMLLTNQTASVGMIRNKIRVQGMHGNTNQYHFDTFKLNEYLTKLCFERQIKMIDGDVKDVAVDSENGNIQSILLENGSSVSGDFWIDASGFHRVLMTKIGNTEWNSYKDYLLCDSAITFQTPSEESREIRPYTRARALSSGWAFELPVLTRRGNGYVYSSAHISKDAAVEEISRVIGPEITPGREFSFDPGYLKKPWVKNCLAVGLSGSFVEPLEATSIGTSIQQMYMAIPYLASYQPHYTHSQNHFNDRFDKFMDNLLMMIRLHYQTDRDDTQFWIDARNAKMNDTLIESLNLWTERMPSRYDYPNNNHELFSAAHFIHVAQGQNVLNRDTINSSIFRMQQKLVVAEKMSNARLGRSNNELIDHREALENINDWK